MNTRQILNNYQYLVDELKELRTALDIISDDLGQGSKAYQIIKREWEEKQRAVNILGNQEWKEMKKI